MTWVVILLASVPVYLSHGEVTYTYSSAEHTACVFLEADPINRPDGYNKPVFQVGPQACRFIRITFILRFHRSPIQLVVFVPVGLSSFLHLRQVLLGVELSSVALPGPFIVGVKSQTEGRSLHIGSFCAAITSLSSYL